MLPQHFVRGLIIFPLNEPYIAQGEAKGEPEQAFAENIVAVAPFAIFKSQVNIRILVRGLAAYFKRETQPE